MDKSRIAVLAIIVGVIVLMLKVVAYLVSDSVALLSDAMVRVFGDPPGEHGTGVGVLIESSKWESIDDLAETYKTWGCHAYGRRWKGEKMPEAFVNKMASLDVTVKNHNDREFDLLDIDDDYEVLGGMNATVRAYGGHKPYSVMGDSSDIDRLKLRTLEGETSYVIRSRVLNPKWLEGLKQHGFSGAIELSKLTEYMGGLVQDFNDTWAKMQSDPLWNQIQAVKDGKVYFVTGLGAGVCEDASIRAVEAVTMFAMMGHPDSFTNKMPMVVGDDYQSYMT